jgi:hypothetical protein
MDAEDGPSTSGRDHQWTEDDRQFMMLAFEQVQANCSASTAAAGRRLQLHGLHARLLGNADARPSNVAEGAVYDDVMQAMEAMRRREVPIG